MTVLTSRPYLAQKKEGGGDISGHVVLGGTPHLSKLYITAVFFNCTITNFNV